MSTKFKNYVDKVYILYYIIVVRHKCVLYGGIAQLARAIGSYPAGHKFKSYCRYHIHGPIVKRLRHHPFTVKSAVRIRLGSPDKKLERNLGLFFFFPQSGRFEICDARCFKLRWSVNTRYSVASLLTNPLGVTNQNPSRIDSVFFIA